MLKYLRLVGVGIVFLWFFVGGIGHFTNMEFFLSIVPPWVPFPVLAVYLSGAIEVVLAVLLFVKKIRPLVGWGIIALTIAVTPANVHMWLNPDLFPDVTPTLLGVRLIVQVFLIALIWWSTRDSSETNSSETNNTEQVA